MIKIKFKYRDGPYLSKEMKKLIEERNIKQKAATESKNKKDWSEFKKIRNKVVKQTRNDKKQYEKDKLSRKNESKDVWKVTKKILNWNKNQTPTQIFENGKMHEKPKDIATILNKYYTEKVNEIKKYIPDNDTDPTEKLKKRMVNRTCNFEIKKVTEEQIKTVIKHIKIL
jgi:hypothetical protein